jgi:hypothetical protein
LELPVSWFFFSYPSAKTDGEPGQLQPPQLLPLWDGCDLGNHAGHQPSELESEGWVIYANGGRGGYAMVSPDGQTVTYATMYNRETGETRYRSYNIVQDDGLGLFGVALGVVASFATFGALAPAATAWAAGTLGVAATTTTATVAGGVIAGAASGIVSQVVSTGSFDNLGQAALAGAIGGGVGGYYGNTWNAGRVVATTAASGVASEVTGGNFRDGALIGGTIALTTWAAYEIRAYELRTSPPEARTGQSAGAFGDREKLGGSRPYQVGTDSTTGDPVIRFRGSPMGGDQGGSGSLFGRSYRPGSFIDRLVEIYAGVHDFANHPWSYNSLGYNDAANSPLGRFLGPRLANTASTVMNWVNVPVVTPVVAVSVIGMSTPTTTLLAARRGRDGPPWGP